MLRHALRAGMTRPASRRHSPMRWRWRATAAEGVGCSVKLNASTNRVWFRPKPSAGTFSCGPRTERAIGPRTRVGPWTRAAKTTPCAVYSSRGYPPQSRQCRAKYRCRKISLCWASFSSIGARRYTLRTLRRPGLKTAVALQLIAGSLPIILVPFGESFALALEPTFLYDRTG
jgi:hypothetical protein